jgi:hypothetical protein
MHRQRIKSAVSTVGTNFRDRECGKHRISGSSGVNNRQAMGNVACKERTDDEEQVLVAAKSLKLRRRCYHECCLHSGGGGGASSNLDEMRVIAGVCGFSWPLHHQIDQSCRSNYVRLWRTIFDQRRGRC